MTPQLMLVVARVECHLEVTLQLLFLKIAGVQVMVLRLETFGFSQDCINLKVDHAGHLRLCSGDGDQFEHPLVFGVRVKHLHGVLSCLLHLL